MKWFQLPEKRSNVVEPLLGGEPENRMLSRVWNFKWFLLRETNQAVVACEPIFGKHADIDVNTDRRAPYTDGIRAILQNMRHGHLLLFTGQRERSTRHLFWSRKFCNAFPFS